MTNRFRIGVTLSVLSLSACTNPRGKPELPESVSPGWKLSSYSLAGDQWQAMYTVASAGNAVAYVKIRPIAGQAVGLDLVQRWRPRANTIVFYGDRYFTIVDWSGVDAAQARSLVRALETALK